MAGIPDGGSRAQPSAKVPRRWRKIAVVLCSPRLKSKGALMMKAVACVATSVLALAACNKGPEVDLHNADTNQVSEGRGAVRRDDQRCDGRARPVEVEGQRARHGYPRHAAPVRGEDETGRWRRAGNKSSQHCIKPGEDVKKPKEGFFGADQAVRYDHFTMGGGKIDIAWPARWKT